MAHTISVPLHNYQSVPHPIAKVRLSVLTSGSAETVTNAAAQSLPAAQVGVPGAHPSHVSIEVVTRPNDSSIPVVEWNPDNDSLTAYTSQLRFMSSSGDLTGCVLDVLFHWDVCATGGIS